jgi:predicted outer membrane repeat protein
MTKKTLLLSLLTVLATESLASAAAHFDSRKHVPNEIIVKFHRNTAASVEKRIRNNTNADNLELFDPKDELNKKYRITEAQALFKNFRKNRDEIKALLKKDKALLNTKEKRILARLKRAPKDARVPDLDRIYKLRIALRPGQSLQETVGAYNRHPDVEYAELNYIVSINLTPNDPFYPLQWPLSNIGQMYPESGQYNSPPGTPDCDIDAPEAWDIYTGNSEIIVAVVDTGVDYTHRDLQNNIWVNESELNGTAGADDDNNGYVDDIYGYDFLNNDSNPMDDNGHGTHCSGIIAAEGDNGLDITGMCWNARIMALKFLDAAGNGNDADAVLAFYYAVENGADVTSNSWGGGSYSQTMEETIDYAHSQGVIMIAAAGNDSSYLPFYPAYYENMFSVAATNSNDEKAPFSNYGDWVDIAAPGVDVLSLRAGGTSLGTTYDNYTTIASGTSMACPHVAGACALLLSINPTLAINDVYDILTGTADPIEQGICLSDGRLNLFNVVLAAAPSQGRIHLDHDYYSCNSVIVISVGDCDLAGQGSWSVTLETTGGDLEMVVLSENTPPVGVFLGTISATAGDPNIKDGMLQLSHGEIITAAYEDTNDGTGNPATATNTAEADCRGPLISNVMTESVGPEPAVTFETDEPSTARVLCGLDCGGAYVIVEEDLVLKSNHTVRLPGVEPETDYFFIVEAVDALGNMSVDDNSGLCYPFTTDSGPRDIYVPGEYPIIQQAIDVSWDGGTVWVADGTYTGVGNHNIDFRGKAITVRSEDGPENCIINSYGGRYSGFVFLSGEGPNSVLDGFTITNCHGRYVDDWYEGYRGGGIFCSDSSPTIQNCIIRNNSGYMGGGMYNWNSSPAVTNCVFYNNTAIRAIYTPGDGGGVYNAAASSPTFINCTFSGNSAANDGGGVCNSVMDMPGTGYMQGCNPILLNCTFNDNSAGGDGGGMYNRLGNPTLTNCTFSSNSSDWDGGGMNNSGTVYDYISPALINCRFHANSAKYSGGLNNRCSNTIITNCTFGGNSATELGGGIRNSYSSTTLTNCILWANQDRNGMYESAQIDQVKDGSGAASVINYCCIQNWTGDLGGTGNMGDEPLFVDLDGADNNLGTEDDNLRLLGGSPCLDAGDNSVVDVSTDLDGNPRIINGTVDMGVYEGPHQGFLLSTESVIVLEGRTATFTVTLAMEPQGEIEATVTHQSGDTDITIQSGASLTFDSSNYFVPQTVTLAAAEDEDYFHGQALFWISAGGLATAGISATEFDNDASSVLYVDDDAPGANNGVSWVDAFRDLQDALRVAPMLHQVNEIHVAKGTYNPDRGLNQVRGDREAAFRLINGLAIRGGYAGFAHTNPDARDIKMYETILSGDLDRDDAEVAHPEALLNEPTRSENSYHVVTGGEADATAVLDGFTITGGNADNTSGEYPYPDYQNSGGGMYSGHGVDRQRSDATVINCRFVANSAIEDGGGMFNGVGYPTVANCTFSGNFARLGGGMNTGDCDATLINCTFSRNSAIVNGGGIAFACDDFPTLINCTFTGNSAGSESGGIWNYDSMGFSMTNCILWGNTDDGGMDESAQIGGWYRRVVNYCCIQGWTGNGTGNINSDPCFVSTGIGSTDFHLKSQAGRWNPVNQRWVRDEVTSPCIDTGDPNSDWTLELWPHGCRINMGAYGGMREAGMSLLDAGSIADIDVDGRIDNSDMKLLIDSWLYEALLLPEDLSRDGIVNFTDFAIFAHCRGLPSPADNPNPADGAMAVSINADMSWTAGSYAASHGVYFGTSCPPPFIGNQSLTTYDPGELAYKTKYYWRIDEIGGVGRTNGLVWSFTTQPSPPPPD